MNGEQLYRLWAQIMYDEGTMVELWDNLDAVDKRGWNKLAEVVAL